MKTIIPIAPITPIIPILLILYSAGAHVLEPSPVIKERGPHHRILQIPVLHSSNSEGGSSPFKSEISNLQSSAPPLPPIHPSTNPTIHHVTELQGGLHRWDTQAGAWVDTHPRFESFPDGAVVRNLQYGLIVAPNLATPNAIDLSLPDGARVQGHLLGLAYTDMEHRTSVLIAEVKDCAGVIGGPEQNELTFADAFTDFNISVTYITGRDRLSQNLILHHQLPHPSEWGLTENAVLEVLTEFTAFPALHQEPRPPVNGIAGKYLRFAAMEFVTGRAFSLGNSDEADSVAMAKTWELFEGNRTFLVEKVPWSTIAPALAQLPPLAKTWKKKDRPLLARDQMRLPKRQQARAALKPIRIATLPGSFKSEISNFQSLASNLPSAAPLRSSFKSQISNLQSPAGTHPSTVPLRSSFKSQISNH